MKNFVVVAAFVFFASIIAALATPDCTGWNYAKTQPADWGKANCGDANNLCFTGGKQQSPVVIESFDTVEEPLLTQVKFNISAFVPGSYIVANQGVRKEIEYNPGRAFITLRGKMFFAQTIEIKVPAENIIKKDANGKPAAAELQIYFQSQQDGPLAVISVLLDVVEKKTDMTAFLGPAIEAFAQINQPGDRFSTPLTGLGDIISSLQIWGSDGYYSFDGSLTAPPCSENVKWIIFSEHQGILQDQLDNLVNHLPNHRNSRPTQRVLRQVLNWDPFTSRPPVKPDNSCEQERSSNGIIDPAFAKDCIQTGDGTQCAFCTFYMYGSPYGTCINRNGASCDDIFKSSTAETFCPVDILCPGSTLSVPVLLSFILVTIMMVFFN